MGVKRRRNQIHVRTGGRVHSTAQTGADIPHLDGSSVRHAARGSPCPIRRGIRKMHMQWNPSPNSRLVSPLYELPRFPSPDPVSPRLIQRFTGLNSSFGVHGFPLDALVLLILRLAPDVHEASALVNIGVNCLAVLYMTCKCVRSSSRVPRLLLSICSRENLKTSR